MQASAPTLPFISPTLPQRSSSSSSTASQFLLSGTFSPRLFVRGGSFFKRLHSPQKAYITVPLYPLSSTQGNLNVVSTCAPVLSARLLTPELAQTRRGASRRAQPADRRLAPGGPAPEEGRGRDAAWES